MTDWNSFRLTLFAVSTCVLNFARTRWYTVISGLIIWEAIRDPIRKLLPSEQVSTAIFGLTLWIAVFWGWRRQASPLLRQEIRRCLNPALFGLAVFLTCSSAQAVAGRVPLNAILLGFLSYAFPLLGYPVGVSFWQDEQRGWDVLKLYCVLNITLLSSAILEVLEFKSPLLGGIVMEWYRFRGDVSIPLPCGLYRSPDIMGLHAAHVAAFAFLLSLRSDTKSSQRLFQALFLCAGVFLIFSARRKMIGLLAVFLMMWFWPWLKSTGSLVASRMNPLFRDRVPEKNAVVLLFILAMFATGLSLPAQTQYAFSILTESPDRLYQSLVHSPLTTFRQSGWWGTGLGTATQGNTFLEAHDSYGWQEDGLGRLMREGGLIPATILLTGIFVSAVRMGILSSLLTTGEDEQSILRRGLTILVLSNVVCLLISHQHFSGDPYFGAMLMFMAGAESCRSGIKERV